MTQRHLWEESVVSLFSHFLQILCLGGKKKGAEGGISILEITPMF